MGGKIKLRHKSVKNIYEEKSIVDYYDKITKEYGIFNSERIIISKYIDHHSKILDVGCGAGRTTIALYEMGYKDIVGLDISEAMIERARIYSKEYEIDFIVGDAREIKKLNDKFDFVFFSFNGLMLIYGYNNRVAILESFKESLNDGGYIIFSTPYLDNKVDKKFWKDKIKENNGVIDETIGDIFLDDNGVDDIYIHIPFIDEVINMINDNELILVEMIPRLDICEEAQFIEDDLDDNMYWVIKKE